METAVECRRKAAQCRRFAEAITARDDPAINALLALAAEWDAKAIEAELRSRRRPSP